MIAQTLIQLDGNIYSCANATVTISCPRTYENGTVVDECLFKTMGCDLQDDVAKHYCTNGTLISRMSTVCNSTTLLNGTNVNETSTVLNCYEGELPLALAGFIPTTTTMAPIITTTERSLSVGARMHIFFLKLIGKGDSVEKKTTTPAPVEDDPRFLLKENETAWIPEALTIPPETTVAPTTEAPYQLYMGIPSFEGNGTMKMKHTELSPIMTKVAEDMKVDTGTYPSYIVKLPLTTTENPGNISETTASNNETTTSGSA